MLNNDPRDINATAVIGVDEVGRGCLAGPVVACAVKIINPKVLKDLTLKDSKQLSPKERLKIIEIALTKRAINYAIGFCDATTIDKLNIHQATLLAMERALRLIGVEGNLVVIDGLYAPKSLTNVKTYVQGDSYLPTISLASIVAKTIRDGYMRSLAKHYPDYGFERHKGYGTLVHRRAIQEKGLISNLHRESFCSNLHKKTVDLFLD